MDEFLTGFDLLKHCFQYCNLWFSHIMARAGATGWWLGAIFTVLVYRFFLSPLIGSVGSDNVRNFKNKVRGSKK